MNPTSALHVGAILFEGFELLDLFGPLEMFGLMGEGARITMLGEETRAVRSSFGPCGVPEVAMGEASGFDVLLVPGGIGTRRERGRPSFIAELRRLAEASRIVATVCTGSYLLAQTGLLDGRRATSNKLVFQEVATGAPTVQWIQKARWVEDGKYWTSSGISAGMDMTLALIAKLRDRATSLQIARKAEYHWQEDGAVDPFGVG